MKVTILGCGTSVGVPALGELGWGTCDPNNPKNLRQRCSILVEINNTNILIDAGPDIRNQLLPLNIKKIDALLITHTHTDHIAGLDEMRGFYYPKKIKVPVFSTPDHGDELLKKFSYLFLKKKSSPSYFQPPLELKTISANDNFSINDISIKSNYQKHGFTYSVGYTFNNTFSYSTDISDINKKHIDMLKGIDLWIVDSLREQPHEAHAHHALTFDWINRVKPKRAILTHLGVTADYQRLLSICPKNVEPGFDGQVIYL